MVDFNSPYYPYEKVSTGFSTMKGAENIPYQILMYLLDLSDKNGYVPVDDNSRPRVRLMKYVYYDEPNPLAQPLPTDAQKLSLVYNGRNAMIDGDEDRQNHPKSYRIYPQQYEEPSQILAKTMLRCYMAREIPRNDFKVTIGLDFQITVNYALDNLNAGPVYSRSYAIHQCLVEALHGVNINGIGTVYYSKIHHGDSGATLYHDEGTNIYRDTFFSIDWQETTVPEFVTEW